ncbi:MAG: hypothetical protein ABIP30_16230, partial [Ferruginibacter sp.]
ALGLYIYSNAPSYTPATAPGEGFTCIDDVARGVLFYMRSSAFATDTAVQRKVFGLMQFVLSMQSANGYFYNFLQTGNVINTFGNTSVDQPKWWSWRALQALTEGEAIIRTKNTSLADKMNQATNKLITVIKNDLVNKPKTTIQTDGIDVPQWLPEGADQASTMILALIPFCQATSDQVMKDYIAKLADGIILTQFGDASHFPYSAFLSSGTTWHAYGNEEAHALFTAGQYLNNAVYISKAKAEVDNFYPWILNTGFKNSFQVKLDNNVLTPYNVLDFEQIAYGIRPMVFAAIDAYTITNDAKYSDLAGHLAAWFLGNNGASTTMYSTANGVCFDAIASGNIVNKNSGAESTIEALLTMQRVSSYPSVKAALKIYKR